MSNTELIELLKFLGLILLSVYISFSVFLTFMITTNMVRIEYTDDKEHSNKEYFFLILEIIIFWPFLLLKSEISKGDK